jgi:hypothetical protein
MQLTNCGKNSIIKNNSFMQKYYKLLSQEMTSHNDTKWELNVPITIHEPGNAMCTDQVLHCYNHPLLAAFLNPIHTNIKEPRIFEIEVDEIVNSDGLNDLIVGHGHSYGLDWYEQKKDGKNSQFIKHPIDPFHSQYHTMEWVDIDNDGKMELITGKRYRAHNSGDPGFNDPLELSYFKWNGESFTKNVISYGEFGKGKGTGIYFSVADLRNTGKKDIILAGKDGLYIIFNE